MGKENVIYLPNGSEHEVLANDIVTEKILKENKPKEIEQFASELGVGVDILMSTISKLRDEGYVFETTGSVVMRTKSSQEGSIYDFSKRLDRQLHFGIVSDTHLSSKKERLDALNEMYDLFEQEGVDIVFHSGDLTDGWGVYRGQEFEVNEFGQQEQIDYAINNYPKREKIQTVFITGNHDLRQYERGGVDVGIPISNQRPDMEYLGQITSTVLLPQGVEMELVHPAGGGSYALSYKAQKYINNLNPKDVPDVLIFGHYHTSFYMHYRNVHFVQASCFKDAGLWEKRLGLNPTIGGWLVDGLISADSDRIERFQPELFTF